jgi:hypothetical protein
MDPAIDPATVFGYCQNPGPKAGCFVTSIQEGIQEL